MSSRPKHFYSHLADLADLEAELNLLEMDKAQKTELMDIAHINLHQAIIDTILSHLTESDKVKFLELMSLGKDEKIWEHLGQKIEKVEDKIVDISTQLKSQLKEDIKKVKS